PRPARRDDAAARHPVLTRQVFKWQDGGDSCLRALAHGRGTRPGARRADRLYFLNAESSTARASNAPLAQARNASACGLLQPPYAQLWRNLSSTSARDSGSCAPPRRWGCLSSSTEPFFSLTRTCPVYSSGYGLSGSTS